MEEVSFDIETQAAAAITNIGGDQTIYSAERRSRVPRAVSVLGLLLSLGGLGLLVLTVTEDRGHTACERLLALGILVLHGCDPEHVATRSDLARRGSRPPHASGACSDGGEQHVDVQHRPAERGEHPEHWRRCRRRGRDPRHGDVGGAPSSAAPSPGRKKAWPAWRCLRLRPATVNESLGAAAQEAAQSTPNRYCVAEHLGAAATTLREAGALLGAGTTVLEALRRAAALLGPIGVAVIGAL